MLKLEFPNETHREMYEDMIEEWSKEDDFENTSPGALFHGKSYQEFLQITNEIQSGKNQDYTPSSIFFLIQDNRILGGIDIRHNIDNPYLRDYAGHISYGIRPSERQKGYATKILKLGLLKAKQMGIKRVLVSCHPDNIASEKVTLKNEGVYEKTVKNSEGIYKRYWITL